MNKSNLKYVGVISATLIASAALWEGTRYTPYEDIVGVLTVCSGYTGKDIARGKKYSPSECKAFLEKELKTHADGVLKCVNVPLQPHQFDAFTLFAYNVGVANFCGSGVLKTLNQGKYTEACNRLSKHPDGSYAWSFAGGKYVQGLQNRRQYETNLCLGKLNPSIP